MPRKLKDLSGKKIIKFLKQNGFSVKKTRGSHCKMNRVALDHNQTLVIPLHSSIPKGTLYDIYNQTAEYLPELNTKDFLFTK